MLQNTWMDTYQEASLDTNENHPSLTGTRNNTCRTGGTHKPTKRTKHNGTLVEGTLCAHKGPYNVLGGTYITLLPGLLLLPVLLAKY